MRFLAEFVISVIIRMQCPCSDHLKQQDFSALQRRPFVLGIGKTSLKQCKKKALDTVVTSSSMNLSAYDDTGRLINDIEHKSRSPKFSDAVIFDQFRLAEVYQGLV